MLWFVVCGVWVYAEGHVDGVEWGGEMESLVVYMLYMGIFHSPLAMYSVEFISVTC
jgi:hypothetical protein